MPRPGAVSLTPAGLVGPGRLRALAALIVVSAAAGLVRAPSGRVRSLAALIVVSAAAGCVANAGPEGFPGTEKNPAATAFTISLDDDAIMPKQTWVKVGAQVTFKDRMGEAHVLNQENRANATIEVPANGATVLTWDRPGDIRLVCQVHGADGMRGWLHVV